MIRSALSSPLRSALSSAFAVRRGGGSPAFTPLALFSSGEQGWWYDPSNLSTLFQDAAGTVPVTAAGQPVGRLMDRRIESVYQETTGIIWTKTAGDGVLSVSGNQVTVTGATTTTLITRTAGSIPFVAGFAKMVVRADYTGATGVQGWVRGAPTALSNGVTTTLTSNLSNSSLERLDVATGTVTFTVTSLAYWRGNHATQSTATARPLLGLDGSGNYYLQFDGVDDALFTSAFAMGSGAVSAFAGIYRNASGTATVCAFTPFGEGESNSFVLWSNRGLVGNDMGMAGKATTLVYSNAGAQAISTPQVLSAFWDTAAPSQSIRLDSTQIASSSSSMGAGNFGTKPLYIGAVSTGNRHNGRLYSLIAVSRLTTAGETADAETFVGAKTGVVL
jgi:hypothetical protein